MSAALTMLMAVDFHSYNAAVKMENLFALSVLLFMSHVCSRCAELVRKSVSH